MIRATASCACYELKPEPGAEVREVADGLNVDIDAAGNVVGFDIDKASKRLDLSTVETIALPLKVIRPGHLDDNPSLKAQLDQAMSSAYRRAANEAAAETGFERSVFPATSPYTFDQAMNPEFWPQ